MASTDIFKLGNLEPTGGDVTGFGPGSGPSKDTGALRRKFNFGDRVSELAIAQDPFFRFVSKVSKGSTDDPNFKFTEKRGSFHKRYAYPIAFSTTSSDFGTAADGAWQHVGDMGATMFSSAGNTVYVKMAGDYKTSGNLQNRFGQTNNEIKIGADGTQPHFFLKGQVVRIPLADSAGGAVSDYALGRVEDIAYQNDDGTPSDHQDCEATHLKLSVVKTSSKQYLPYAVDLAADSVAGSRIHDQLEPMRSYVVGSAFAEGTGYPDTWKDQPYSTNYGLTQIWKTSMAMTNTARATVLKYDANEWARVWKEKLVEHKWDIETSLLFGTQYEDTANNLFYTQGAVDYILNYGNSFNLETDTKTADDFLDDMSSYIDPRYNHSTATVFFCRTDVWNWMHKLGGYFKNNLEISSNFRSDLALTGKKKVFGVDISTFSTPYGDINVARNIHLDGTNVKMLGVGMKYCKYRPLVGNGINRDTSVYVGVQTLENSGIDRRVDIILTEAGMEWSMPECHAVWL